MVQSIDQKKSIVGREAPTLHILENYTKLYDNR